MWPNKRRVVTNIKNIKKLSIQSIHSTAKATVQEANANLAVCKLADLF
jgi:hypothetical protein